MNVQDRIKTAKICDVIDLTHEEKHLYTGAGHRIARFENGTLVELWNPGKLPYRDNVQEMANETIQKAVEFIQSNPSEYWLVICSGYQLCEPYPIILNDASSLARMARILSEALLD